MRNFKDFKHFAERFIVIWNIQFSGGLFFILLLLLFLAESSNAQTLITLNSAKTYQTITGWEAVAEAGHEERKAAFEAAKNVLFEMAYEVGVNRLHLSIFSGQENPVDYFTPWITGKEPRLYWVSHWQQPVNDNNDPFTINWAGFKFSELDYTIEKVVLPLKNVLEANGEQLYVNLCYVSFDPSPFNHYSNPEEYAEFMLAAYEHMSQKYGWVPDAIEVILEPDHPSQPGWSADQLAKALIAAALRLENNGYRPDFIAPSTLSMYNAITYFDQMVASEPRVLNYIKDLSYHRYSGVSLNNLREIANRSVQYNIGASMLEWWAWGNTYRTLHEDLKVGRNTAWQQGTLAGQAEWNPKTSILVIDSSDPNNVITRLHDKTKFTRQYYKFIRAGAVRIEATTSNNNFDPLAFINTNGRYVVVVKAGSSGSFTIQGLPAGTYGIKYTTASQYDVDLPDDIISVNQALTTNIPEEGVLTVYAKTAGPDTTPPLPPTGLRAKDVN